MDTQMEIDGAVDPHGVDGEVRHERDDGHLDHLPLAQMAKDQRRDGMGADHHIRPLVADPPHDSPLGQDGEQRLKGAAETGDQIPGLVGRLVHPRRPPQLHFIVAPHKRTDPEGGSPEHIEDHGLVSSGFKSADELASSAVMARSQTG